MDNRYPKTEKLKGRTLIDKLFRDGKSVSKFPLRLVYMPAVFDDGAPIKMGVSVSKKHFKRAVDRNYIKRLLRECYRLDKAQLSIPEKTYAMMLLFQSRDVLAFEEIQEKFRQLAEKFQAQENRS
jgi:ribonuclease P protein component